MARSGKGAKILCLSALPFGGESQRADSTTVSSVLVKVKTCLRGKGPRGQSRCEIGGYGTLSGPFAGNKPTHPI